MQNLDFSRVGVFSDQGVSPDEERVFRQPEVTEKVVKQLMLLCTVPMEMLDKMAN